MKAKIQGFIVSALFFGLLTASFQNCSNTSSPVAFSSKSLAPGASETDGTGGQPYDGKIYVTTGDLCPDRTNIHSRIILKSATAGELVRDKCRDITPISLGSNDFQIDPTNPERLSYLNQSFVSENLVLIANINAVKGFGYWLRQNFGTPGDTMDAPTRSVLRVFENGVELGPAHSIDPDIETLGGGRFSHWDSTATISALYLSTSDNTDPRTNGRKYTYIVGP